MHQGASKSKVPVLWGKEMIRHNKTQTKTGVGMEMETKRGSNGASAFILSSFR